jgi:flagellar hook-associated protein 3 FlgL
MRVTSFMIFNQLIRGLRRQYSTSADLQQQLATGKRINKPSDDVAGTMRSLDYRVSINEYGQYRRNIDEGSVRLRVTDTVLAAVDKTLSDIRSLMALGGSGSQDPVDRNRYAQHAAQLRDQLADFSAETYQNRYLFSGFRTDVPPYTAGPAYAYQGDNGVMNVSIDRTEAVAVNVTGSQVFSYSLAAPEVKQLGSGEIVHYTPGAGTAVSVEIRASDDVTVLDTFTFSNVMQMTDLLRGAFSTNNTARIEALRDPFNRISTQVRTTQAEVGMRLSRMQDQSASLQSVTVALQNARSGVEDADPLETAAGLKMLDATLQSLHESASRVLSQSLLDFLQ